MKNTAINLVIIQDGKKVDERTGDQLWEQLARTLINDKIGAKLNGQRVTIRTNYKTGGETITIKFISNGFKFEYIYSY